MLRRARWARGRASWWRGATVVAVGTVAAVLLAAAPAVAIPVDPGGGDPPDDCVAGTTATLSVTPGTVVAGGGVTVSWSIDQIVGCTTFKWIDGAGFGGSSVALSGSRSVTLTTVGTASWSLEVSGSAGRTYTLATASVTVQAPPPPLAAVSPLAAAVDANGEVQVIMARGDDVVLRDGQVSQGGRFEGWATAPGLLRSVASETDGSGRVVQVGFNGAGQVWGAIQDVPGGAGWVGWTAIDGLINSVALARNADGRLELFATNGAGTIFHRTQISAGTVSFGQWSTLPGLLTQIAAEANADGRIEVVGINSANQVWHQSQTAPNSQTWSGWVQFPDPLTSIAVARGTFGTLEIFGTDSTGALRMRVQSAPNSSEWGGLFTIRDGHGGPVAAETSPDGHTLLFGRDGAGAMALRRQSLTGGPVFDDWQPLIQYRIGLASGTKHKLLVIPVNWTAGNGTPAAPPSKSLNDVMALVDNPWWAEVSYGQFTGWDVLGYGPITIPPPRVDSGGFCGDDFLHDIAVQADYQAINNGGIPLAQYSVMYWFTDIGEQCGWSGKRLNNRIFINGGNEYTVNHELGHMVGLDHASSWNCVDSAGNRVTWSNACTRDEYGDPSDTMGHPPICVECGSGYNSVERNRLGWMSGRIADVPATGGSYTLAPLELTTPGLQVLRLTDGTPLWIEYRERIGVDTSHLPTPGVLVYAPYADGASGMLDLTPATNRISDGNLSVGSTWITPTANFKITLDWAVSTGAHITISLNRATVPNVVGTDAATAESTLQAAGFLYDVHEVVDSTCTRLNRVTGQGPAGLAQAIPGSMVTIDVNVAPAPPAECA